MKKELEIGDEVFIFQYIHEWGINQNYEHFIKGKVIRKELSNDLSYHGSPWYVENYTVLGEDGITYFGNYKHPTLGNSFFMTQEDYIHYLERKISNNQEKILVIDEENHKIRAMIENVQKIKTNNDIKQLVKKKDSKM